MMTFIRHHLVCLISAIILSILFGAGLIWLDMRMKARTTQYPSAIDSHHRPTFIINESLPVDPQVAANPGKTPRTYRTNIQWLKQHQQDAAHIAALELEVTSLKADKALAASSANR